MLSIEPNSYNEKFNITVTGHQGADGFRKLRSILISKQYPVKLVVGPDVSSHSLSRNSYLYE